MEDEVVADVRTDFDVDALKSAGSVDILYFIRNYRRSDVTEKTTDQKEVTRNARPRDL